MTIELLSRLIVLTSLLIGLDLLIVRFRRSQDWKTFPLAQILTSWLEKLQVTPRLSRLRIKLPAGLSAVKKKESTPKAESAISPLETESVISVLPSPENKSKAAAAGMARVRISADVPPGTVIHITITTDQAGHATVQKTELPASKPAAARRRFSLPVPRIDLRALLEIPALKLANGLFAFALGIYLLTRLTGLTNYPIYFFGDEAVQTVSAAELVRHGLHGPGGDFLPTYFQNGAYFNLSLSVYLQVLPHLLFGNSIFVTRGTSVLVTLLAVFAVGKLMKNAFRARYWWAGSLLLAVIPAWFLHSRTAFETALFVSFYAAFLYFYLEYLRDPRQISWAALMAGLAFYSYSPGQLVLAVTGLFLLLNDLKYHWRQRKSLLLAVLLVALIALPYLRFRLTSDYSPLDHLRQLGSYWIEPLPLAEKLTRYIQTYAYGLSPQYWFADINSDLVRHHMLGYGNLPLWMLPLILTGLAVAVFRFRESAYRVVLLAALAAPSGAALAEIGITRVLVFVVPASLLAAIGLEFLLEWLEKLLHARGWRLFSGPAFGNALTLLVFVTLTLLNLSMLTDALVNGPTWYKDYGLYGMQFGAKQIYEETVIPILKQDEEAHFVITPSWANGAEQFLGFFIPRQYLPRVMLGQIYDLLPQRPNLTDKTYFVVSPEEHEKILNDPKFKDVTDRLTIPYPDGRPGFYVVNLKLSDNFDAILAAEEQARRQPVEENFELKGQVIRAIHSPLGGGTLLDMMDGDPHTLAKGAEANPLLLEYFFPSPVKASQLILTTGSMSNFDVILYLYPAGSSQPVYYSSNFTGLPPDPTVTIPFTNGPASFDHITISIQDYGQGEFAQVHVREITFK